MVTIAFCVGTQSREVRLRDIEFDLKIVQVRERDHRTLRAARSGAGKLSRNQFTFFGRAIKNRARHWCANYRGVQLRLRVVELALRLGHGALGASDLFGSRPDLGELECLSPGNSRVADRTRTSPLRRRAACRETTPPLASSLGAIERELVV